MKHALFSEPTGTIRYPATIVVFTTPSHT